MRHKSEQIVAYAYGDDQTNTERASVEAHLVKCSECQEYVAYVQIFMQHFREKQEEELSATETCLDSSSQAMTPVENVQAMVEDAGGNAPIGSKGRHQKPKKRRDTEETSQGLGGGFLAGSLPFPKLVPVTVVGFAYRPDTDNPKTRKSRPLTSPMTSRGVVSRRRAPLKKDTEAGIPVRKVRKFTISDKPAVETADKKTKNSTPGHKRVIRKAKRPGSDQE